MSSLAVPKPTTHLGGDCPWPMLLIATGCLLALAIVLFVLPKATYTAQAPHDIFTFFDGMHRLHIGQSPYVDFHTPFGWLVYGLPYLGYLALGQFGGAIEFGSVVMLAILLPLAAVALRGRTPTSAGLLMLLALFVVVVVPWPFGDSGFAVSQVMFYNRWGPALLASLFLFGLPAAKSDGKGQGAFRRMLDSAAIAALLSLLFFVKVTYFAVGLVFVLLFGVTMGRFRRTGSWGVAVFLLAVLGVQAAGGWVDDYLGDLLHTLKMAAEPGSEAHDERPGILDVFITALNGLVLAGMACGVATLHQRPRLHDMLLIAYVAATSVVLASQDSNNPSFLFALAVLFVWMATVCPRRSGHRRLIMAAMCLFLLPSFLRQLLAAVLFLMASQGACPSCASGLPRMEGAWFGGLGGANAFEEGVLHMSSPPEVLLWSRRNPLHSHMDLSNAEYLHTLRSGLALLKEAGTGNDVVSTPDYANPFPMLLGAPSPKGVLSILHVGRHINRRTAADRSLVFGDAKWLMVPKFPTKQETTNLILNAQADNLKTAWQQVAENEHWRLLRRVYDSPSRQSHHRK